MFGINSLEALKYTIFEQTISVDLIGKNPSIETFKSNSDKLLTSLGKKSLSFFHGVPFIKNFTSAIESAAFLSISNSIICIDDFERKSDRVTLRDILGLVLLLKEQRNCKVVLIFNDEKMGNDNFDEYKRFREKVIDFEMEFHPTSKECVEIALPNQEPLMKEVGALLEKLEINNIRIIKKIERIANLLYPLLNKYEKGVMSQALHTLCLYALCFYCSDKSIPDYEYLKDIGYTLLGFDDEKEQSDEEKGWNAFLREYNYDHADEFDFIIAEIVEKGYVQKERLQEEAEKLNAQLIATKSSSSFSKAWDLYHNSFSNNQAGVINGLYESFKENAKYISRGNLNGTVMLFRELNENKLADELLEIYIREHENNPALFDLNHYSFAGDITDALIIEKFAKLTDKYKEVRTVRDVLSKISGRNGWSREDEKILANANSDEFYKVFKNEEGEHLSTYVDTCLHFNRCTNASEEQKTISLNATLALKKIAKESPINAIRVKKFGIRFETEENREQGDA